MWESSAHNTLFRRMRRLRCGLCVRSLERRRDGDATKEEARTTDGEPVEPLLSDDAEDSSADDTETILYGLASPTTAETRTDSEESPPPEERPHRNLTSSRGRRLRQTSLEWLDPWADLARSRMSEEVRR